MDIIKSELFNTFFFLMNHLKLLSVFGSVYGFELHPHEQSTFSEEAYKNVMLGSAWRFNNVKLYVN